MATKHDDPCRDRAADDEPIFTLRAQDKLAPVLVRMWVELADLVGVNQAKADEAQDVGEEMQAWQLKNREKVKVPD